mmetsp:Transcript_14871/g.32113  ORF Transcript_14871/g.32113 Transcript_14871/m.32113 type:complete len:174 (-) Transcript_14871:93-614(-)|eukprot:CAMPEP_0206463990 /NCGR_PEP_ID=MMETSP0324_2-20121206/26945_1 /ASSEMBLY_ACC=CAM_ASM_000836 /TAXON_ID=2866 /ORGANISM="Crypthecodinium cohnii, Strain Seligo" /LENGTH=173 /DNA_ID=CAMNT_0053936527 /DNA_START=44 /DNA_END=565 /DNA_ORIENTATION=+
MAACLRQLSTQLGTRPLLQPALPLLQTRSFALEASGMPRLRLRGLPYNATANEVRAFFAGYQLASTGEKSSSPIEIVRGVGGRPTGQALAYFEDAVEAIRAKDALHKRPWCVMGTDVYRVEILEDFRGRTLVTDEDTPGDVTEEKLRDAARKSMIGNTYRDREQMKQMKYRQY